MVGRSRIDPWRGIRNAFTRVRWITDHKKQAGWGSVVAPLHAVVQMLMLHPSAKTKAIRATPVKTE